MLPLHRLLVELLVGGVPVPVVVVDVDDLHAVPVHDGARATARQAAHLDVAGAEKKAVGFVRHDPANDVPVTLAHDDTAAAALADATIRGEVSEGPVRQVIDVLDQREDPAVETMVAEAREARGKSAQQG